MSLRSDYANVGLAHGLPSARIEGAIGDASFHTVGPLIIVRGSAALWSGQLVPG